MEGMGGGGAIVLDSRGGEWREVVGWMGEGGRDTSEHDGGRTNIFSFIPVQSEDFLIIII